jgi:hypothetical protein
MTVPNLAQLAPNLSAEERYKLISADILAQMDGEPPMLSESETKAMLWFESKAAWREYALRICLFRLANSMWIQEIETEKLRTYAYYLHMSHTFEKIIVGTGYDLPKKYWAKQFETLKECVIHVHDSAEGFFAYRDAIPKLEEIICGMPFFSKTTKASLTTQFALIGEIISDFNKDVNRFCECRDAKKFIRPIVDDRESYLIRDVVPSEEAVNELIDFIQRRAGSEMQSRE